MNTKKVMYICFVFFLFVCQNSFSENDMIFDPLTIFKNQGIAFTMKQFVSIINIYNDVVQKILDTNKYKFLMIGEDENNLYTTYTKQNIFRRDGALIPFDVIIYKIDKSTGLQMQSFWGEKNISLRDDKSFDLSIILKKQGIVFTVKQLTGLVNTYNDISQKVSNLNEYEFVIIQEGKKSLYVSYNHENVYQRNRKLISTDIMTYEINNANGKIRRFYYGIR